MIRKIRVVLVDDERLARVRLAALLAIHPEVEVVGEAGDIETAAALCAGLLPDAVFLDIQLPGSSGFELLPLLVGKPAIIFVTAYDRFAMRAFEVNALDYLLKPIHPERLARSLMRLQTLHPETSIPLNEVDLVALKEDRLLRMVPVTSITHIKAEDNYSSVHLLDMAPAFVRRSLAEWEKLLPPEHFLRVERSLIIRLDAVHSMRAESRDSMELIISGQSQPILLGRRGALFLRRALENC
jgi:two-component system LytT family response regulator